MDLPGSACAPRFTYIHLNSFILDAIRSRQTINLGQFELIPLCEHIIGGWRDLDMLTPHEAHHSSRIMRTYHTYFGVPLGNTPGWWDDRKRNQKPPCVASLPSLGHSQQPQPRTFLPSPFWPQLSGPKKRHDRNRRPYELRICDRCDWHTIQDEEHILLDCPHDHLVRLRTQHQLIFPPQFEDGPARLRTFMTNLIFLVLPLLQLSA